MSGSGTFSGAVTCTGSAEIRDSGSGAMTISNAIGGSMGGGGLTINAAGGNTITLSNNINVSNSSGVTFANGTVLLKRQRELLGRRGDDHRRHAQAHGGQQPAQRNHRHA